MKQFSFDFDYPIHPDKKLSDMDVAKIKCQYAKGSTQAEIAQRFGVTQGHISQIVNAKRRTRHESLHSKS